MKYLLVSVVGLEGNSTQHVLAFGAGLAQAGLGVWTAVPNPHSARGRFTFHRIDERGQIVDPAAAPPRHRFDMVHLWTPRAPVWRFLEQHKRLIGGPVILHLEDDEDDILSEYGVGALARGDYVPPSVLRARGLTDWSNPVLARCLAHAVDGITLLSPHLADCVPATQPRLLVAPPLRPEWTQPDEERSPVAHNGGRSPAVVYAGAVHPAVARDFELACQAVDMLRARGSDVRFFRTGPPFHPDCGELARRTSGQFCDLGFLSEHKLRNLLRQASVLLQPGVPTRFNLRRFPSKIPPYLASGTPVVMPAFYDWLGIQEGVHASFLHKGSAEEIATSIATLLRNPDAAREMGARAAAFARERFEASNCCAPLIGFLRNLPKKPRVDWRRITHPQVELPLLLSQSDQSPSLPPPPTLRRVALDELRKPAYVSPHIWTTAQMYWPVDGGFNEASSTRLPFASGRWRRLIFECAPLPKGSRVRFDPVVHTGHFEIAAITYCSDTAGSDIQMRPSFAGDGQPSSAGNVIALPNGRTWRWISTGADPQLLLPPTPNERCVGIKVWVRWAPLD